MANPIANILDRSNELFRRAVAPSGQIGLKDEKNPGTPEYEQRMTDLDSGLDVLREWQEDQPVYFELYNRISKNRDFYLGETAQQLDLTKAEEGDLRLVFNLGATIIDLFTYILTNNPPYVQFIPDDAKPMSQLRANFAEELVQKIFYDAKFHKRFKEAGKTHFMLGFAWPFWVWNPDNKDGGEKGTLELTNLNAFTTRVRYASNDYEKIESLITVKRLSPLEIMKKYDFEALPDTEDTFIPKEIQIIDDGKTSVFRRYDDKTIKVVVNGRTVYEETHDYGFVPVKQVDNIFVPNDAHGHAESERWQGIAQELNALLSAASEIARDLAYPPILEYNNALGGRKIPKWRGQKVPVRRSDKGESVAFMSNPAQIQPLLKQAELLLDLLHFTSLMPKAAAGVFEANVTSGFQAKLAMNPATLTTESRKVDWNVAIADMVKMAFKILRKETPEIFEIDVDGNKVNFDELEEQRMEIIWPDNLPVDIAREIQNLVLGIQQNLTSTQQAIDKYNVLMGLGSATDTVDYLEEESKNVDLNPERVEKVAKARQALAQLDRTMKEADVKLQQLRQGLNQGGPAVPPAAQLPANGALPAGQPSNPTNLLRGAGSPLPEEQRTTSASAETVPLESTSGVLPNGGQV